MELIQRFEAGKTDEQVAKFLEGYNKNLANQPDLIPEEYVQGVREIGEHLFIKKLVTDQPALMASVEEIFIPSDNQDIRLRIYTPNGEGPFPVLFFVHGGGWCVGSLNTHDALVRFLAKNSGCVAVSVDYRLAPEHKYPAGLDDVETAYHWVLEHQQQLQGNGQIALVGDSAGGNLVTCLAMKCRNEGIPAANFQLLIYPSTDLVSMNTESHHLFGQGHYLTEAQMKGYRDMYLPDKRDAFQDYVSPLHSHDLRDLPPAIICTAELDPLRDEGEAYAQKLYQAGVPVHCIRYNGLIHAFIQMDRIIDKAQIAQKELSELIRQFFSRYSSAKSKSM